MQSILFRWLPNLVGVICLMLIYLIFTNQQLPELSLPIDDVQNFKIILLSIVLEAIPFILLGVIISALLQTFVSDHMVRRFIPKNPVLGVIFACLLGIVFPLCECGMIPVVRRLIAKGMPVYVGVTYILAAPIINPVVFTSTYMAFRSQPDLIYARMGLAFVVAALIGTILYVTVHKNPLRNNVSTMQMAYQEHPHAGRNKLNETLTHASDEFFEMGKYLLFGSVLTALIQTMISRETLVDLGQGFMGSHLFMAGFAYILSLCSTSDAFVAASFTTTFSKSALLTFLVFGPMLDLKNTLMLLSVFRTKFVLILMALITVSVLTLSILVEKLGFIS